MRDLMFEASAFEEFQDWIRVDKKIAIKISELIKDVLKSPFTGLVKPEPLKADWQGYWSRRITDEHRLIYKVTNTTTIIASCYSHYK